MNLKRFYPKKLSRHHQKIIAKINRTILLALLLFVPSFLLYSQNPQQKIRLFIDCSNSYCDMNFIKTEINFVDYVLDYKVADIHILITQQVNGGGGSQYQLIFFGENRFKGKTDTLKYNVKANSTDFEIRNLQLKYIQLGLIPFISMTEGIDNLTIQLKYNSVIGESSNKIGLIKEPWDYWVFNMNISGSLSADQVYKFFRYTGTLTASRITDKLKVRFNLSGGKNRSSYQYGDTTTGITKIVVNNSNYDFFHQIVKSLNEHWSIGYDLDISRSTFTNYEMRTLFKPAVEYDVFPYKEVNNKLFTLRYGVDLINNNYFDTTIYLKKKETLLGQGLDVALTFNQKWGTVNFSANAHSYFSIPKYYNIGIGGGVNVRITGGLSLNIFVFGNYQRDQIYLPKGLATEQEVLTRRRQLATNYTYYSYFGISYRFGSKLNNFVNPRFEGSGANFFFSN